jgi:hypothetical protein
VSNEPSYAETIGPAHRHTAVTWKFGRLEGGEFIEESRDERLSRLLRQYENAKAEMQRALDELPWPDEP